MLLSLMTRLKSKNIVLVSSSPRRKEIFDQVGLAVQAVKSEFDEDLLRIDFPSIPAFVKATALEKSSLYKRRSGDDVVDLLISADTVVVLEDEIIGKPHNTDDAKRILKKLSGKSHSVITGVALVAFEPKIKGEKRKYTEHTFHEETAVRFGVLSDEMIDLYLDTREPLGKAGAYAIQGKGAMLIESIIGDFYNVMGFPIFKFSNEIFNLFERKIL